MRTFFENVCENHANRLVRLSEILGIELNMITRDDILENNPYKHLSDERKQKVKALCKGYKTVTGTMKQELADMGFELMEAGKHFKLTYHGDPRYLVTVGKTPSDNRSGSNTAAAISKTML